MLARYIARLLGLLHELPGPFHGRIANVDYDVQPLSRGMVSISISLPRAKMVVKPICFRKSEGGGFTSDRKVEGADSNDRNIEHQVRSLFYMGPQSVNIGSTGDRIEAIFAGESIRVDKALAERVVPCLMGIRCEALGLGEQAPYKMTRPWSKEAESPLDLDGQIVIFEFSSCLVYTEDDLAGNLELMVRTTPWLSVDKIGENLRLALPGFDDLAASDGYGQFDDGEGIVGVEFGLVHSAIDFDGDVREAIESIQEVDIFWGDTRETRLATVPCVRASENA